VSRSIGILLLSCVLAMPAHAQEDLSSKRDYTDNAQRDRPIACKAGDIEDYAGKSMGDVFGKDWPAQPEASSPEARTQVRMLERGTIRWPGGLDPQDAFTVVAVLVDAAGKPVRAVVLCKTRVGFDKAARTYMMSSTYQPAMIDGKPVASVAVQVISIRSVERDAQPRRPRGT
jgi:hypothetical protein